MNEFEETLNAILQNPDALSQVMNLAQSLHLGGGGAGSETAGENGGASGSASPRSGAEPSGGNETGGAESRKGGLGGLEGLADLLGGIDANLIARLLPLVGELTQGNDERAQLLYALKPFLKPERRDKIDQALKTAKLITMGKKLLTAMGESNV